MPRRSRRPCAPRRSPAPDALAHAKAWAGAIGRPLTDAAWSALPAALKSDPGLALCARPDAAPRRPRAGSRSADQQRAARRRLHRRRPLVGGAADGRAPPARRRPDQRRLCALRRTFRRLDPLARRRGISRRLDRLALPQRRRARRPSFRDRGGDRARRRWRSRAPPIGRAAPPSRRSAPTRRSAFTSAPPPIRSPITASSPLKSCTGRR